MLGVAGLPVDVGQLKHYVVFNNVLLLTRIQATMLNNYVGTKTTSLLFPSRKCLRLCLFKRCMTTRWLRNRLWFLIIVMMIFDFCSKLFSKEPHYC